MHRCADRTHPCERPEAERFLRTLDSTSTNFCFQTFDDNAARKAKNTAPLFRNGKPVLNRNGKPKRGKDPFARTINGSLDRCWDQLVALNQQGAGVFVTINETKRGSRRLATNVIRVRALFVDLDGAPLDPVQNDPTFPTPTDIIISSVAKWHCYWGLRDDGIALDQFKSLQQALAKRFGGDPSINDLNRVMRLPGFWHGKGEPFAVRMMLSETCGNGHYTGKELVEALANPVADTAETDKVAEYFETIGDEQQKSSQWRDLNDKALANLSAWVPALFPEATAYQDGYRVSSASLKRTNQEDLSIVPAGIVDFGVHDLGDARQGKRSPIDLAMEWSQMDFAAATGWLRDKLGLDPQHAPGTRREESPPSIPELFWHGEPDTRPVASWLAYQLIPEKGVGLMSGHWGAAKTFAALDLAGSTAAKLSFAGRDIIRPGGVLFVAAEGGEEVRTRIKGVNQKLSAAAFVAAAAGNATDADLSHLPLVWHEEPIRFQTPEGYRKLLTIAAAVHQRMLTDFGVPLVLIIIDTMGSSVDFQDANSSNEAQAVMNRLREISTKTGTFVLVIDHFGKNVEAGTRNSVVKEDASDLVLAMLCDRDVGGTISNTRMRIRKLRRGKSGTEFPFDLTVADIGDSESTCFITWKPESAAGKTGKASWTKALRIFKGTIETVLIDHGRDLRPYGNAGPMVKAVPISNVRTEFILSYPADAEDARAREAVKRAAFNRALKDARERLLICSREIDGVDQLWLVNEEELEFLKQNPG